MRSGGGAWPPRHRCFAPRLGEYLARLKPAPLASLLARPAALARAFRRASELLELEVECLDVPASWILHSAGWPATVGEHGIELGPASAELRAPIETVGNGPLLAVQEALRALPPLATTPATLLALPSPTKLAQAAGEGKANWARAALQAFVRSVGELDLLAGVMLDGDDGLAALGPLLDHYRLTPVCIRRPSDTRLLPPGVMAARALPIEAIMVSAPGEADSLVTTDGPVSPLVAPEELLRASRAVATG